MTTELTPYNLLVNFAYSVIPSGGGPAGKSPLISWEPYQHQIPELEDVQRWEHELRPSLWGVVTGAVSSVVIVDIDRPELRAMFDEIGLAPHIETPRGGFHYWFAHPGHPVKTVAGLLPGVDIRGDGGFCNILGRRKDGDYKVLIPPSLDALYSWEKLPEPIALAMNNQKPRAASLGESPIATGERNAALASIAGSLRKRGVAQNAIEAALIGVNLAQCSPPLGECEVIEIARSIARYSDGAKPGEQPLSQVVATGRHMRDVTSEALAKLYERNEPARIFRRSDGLTRICVDERGRPYTDAMNEAAFRGELDRACNFVRLGREGDTAPVPPPLDVVRDGLTRPGDWRFPPLLGIIEAPALRPDGTILDTPGYDSATRLYYHPAPGLDVPAIPDRPTDSQLEDAKRMVVEALADFPFDSKASWCNAIGTVLAPVVRPMVDGPVPMALFDKPQAGTGASLLAEVISTIATGRPAAMMTMPADDEGMRKAITSILVQGQLVCTIDNIEGDLWAPSLAALLTLMTWRDCILGASKIVELPHRSVWIATGNNIRLRGDLPRRCIWCRMDAQVAQPWLRDIQRFRHPDLRGWVLDYRGPILAAILTVAREWVRAGRPVPAGIPILGGYEDYCRVTNGVLAFMGAKDFMGNLADLYDEADRDTPQWEGFLEAWHDVLGEKGYTSAELIEHMNDNETLRGALPDVLGYLMERKPGEVKNYGVRLGQKLAVYNGRRYPNDLVLQKSGTKKRAVCWMVVRLPPGSTSPNFVLESEVGEVRATLTCGRENNAYRGGGAETSLSSPSATKKGEVVGEDSGGISDLAKDADFQFMCENCKGKRYWLRGGTTKLCAICRPPADGARIIHSV